MAELFKIGAVHGDPVSHVIFFHGLGGHHHKTWSLLSDTNVCWPAWLADDNEGLNVWTVGYKAAISRWRGSAMHLPDRAKNVLERIFLEPSLKSGEIILIGHSLGGLVIKQLLRTAESLAYQSIDADSFIRRVRRVAFLATPHAGAGLATWGNRLRIAIRPSYATICLVRNNPLLQDLNVWYRHWSQKQQITHLILCENEPIRIAGLIVEPDSSDPGLSEDPIRLDETHISICKPPNRSSEVYRHVQRLITRPLQPPPADQEQIMDGLKEHKIQLTELVNSTKAGYSQLRNDISQQTEKTAELITNQIKSDLSNLSSSISKYPTGIIDKLIKEEVSILRRARFLQGFSRFEHSLRLAQKVNNGDFQGGSDGAKSEALAWCSRVLAVSESIDKAEEFLIRARELGNGPEIAIAEAFLISARGDFEGALAVISHFDTHNARTASFMIATMHYDNSAAVDWLARAGISFFDLDADGKFLLITKQFDLGRWDIALEHAQSLNEADFEAAPVLFYTAALANLVQAIPADIRSNLPTQVPFESLRFPLASDNNSLVYRRQAHDLFQKGVPVVRELGCLQASYVIEDYLLWLELRDPKEHESGLRKLEESMREPEHRLRRLRLALEFDLNLDLAAVEREIDEQTVLSGDTSPDAAFARFSLAFTKKDPKGTADYIRLHRKQLTRHLGATAIKFYEIQMLAAAGLLDQAEECLSSSVDEGFSEVEREKLLVIINEARDTEPIRTHREKFEQDGQLVDLGILVELLERRRDWEQFCHFGALLFERTKTLRDAERLAIALNETARFGELSELLRRYPEFVGQSDALQMLWCWSLYREGLLTESKVVLDRLQAKRDHPNDRLLAVRLAIASGKWESLLSFIETEWDNRTRRAAPELIQVAQLAQFAGSPRTKGLVRQAVEKDPENPRILVAAYGLATSAGWENNEEVAQWLQKAAELSDEKGPIQKGSLQDLLDRAPEWNRRQEETWHQVNEGSLPIFCAAHLVNQSLIDFFLFPAIANLQEQDPRRRGLVPAFAGVRQLLPCTFSKVVMDPSILLTLGMLDLLDITAKFFDRIVIPHSTLSWLFEEKQKVSFHQPSRIKKASELSELLASGALKEFSPSATMDGDLAREVGEELASLIAEASTSNTGDQRQRVVIISSPIHRIGSLMDEEADVSSYSSHICNCSSVIDKLKQKGQLTVAEESRARSYLSLHEKTWLSQPTILDNAVLYLDDISVTYLQHIGVLAKFRSAGLEAHVSERTLTEVNSLLRYEHLASKVNDVVERIRVFLAKGIRTGKIELAVMRPDNEAHQENIQNHPTFGLFNSETDVEAIFVDDRTLNKHGNADTGSKQIPILTTLDLLHALYSTRRITLDQMLEFRTHLRRAGFIFVPVTNDELERYISSSALVNGTILETAELKAIRENLLRVQMSRFLQLPYEITWLNDTMQTLTETLKSQWRDEVDDQTARARSDWLLGLLDRRGWAHCFKGDVNLSRVQYWYGPQLMLLMSPPANVSPETKEKYFEWLDGRVLKDIREEDPDLSVWIVERAKEVIANVVEACLTDDLN